MTLASEIIGVQHLQAGEWIGYGRPTRRRRR